MKPFKTNGLIAPGSIPRSLLRTFNFEIWKLKCLGACPEDLYSMKGFTTAMTPNRSRVDTTSRYHQEVKTMNTKQGKFSSLWPRELRKGSALIVTLVIGIGLLSVIGVSLRWGVTEKRLNIQHIRRQQAKNASESLVEYGFAELVARFTGQTSFPSDELEQRPLAVASTHSSFYSGTNISLASGDAEVVGGQITPSQQVYIDPNNPANEFDPMRGKLVVVREIAVYAKATALPRGFGSSITSYTMQRLQVRDSPLFSHAIFYNMDPIASHSMKCESVTL